MTLLVVTALVTIGFSPGGAAGGGHDAVVSEDPVDWTPAVLDGQVKAIAVIGSTVVVGGVFTRVRANNSSTVLVRKNLFSFKTTNGMIDPAFVPEVDGVVEALVPASDGTSVFAGGEFGAANREASKGLTRLDLSTGHAVPGFRGTIQGRSVRDLALHEGRLFIGGAFFRSTGLRATTLPPWPPTPGCSTTTWTCRSPTPSVRD